MIGPAPGHAYWEVVMEFGYFTLSDNDYIDNRRTPNELVAQIISEALYADRLGMHSAWIGEHHFSTLGVLSCPDMVLSYIAGQTKNIRLAPAVTVLPLHHPVHVAEHWSTLDLVSGGRVDFAAGRGYDRREYLPFKAPFEDNSAMFAEGIELVQRLWASDKPLTHKGKYYQLDNLKITPQPVQRPIPIYVASFSKPSIELAARLGANLVVAPFAVAMAFGGLKPAADLYKEACVQQGKKPGRLVCSYFTHFADDAKSEAAARERQLRYFKECVIGALPGDPKTAPPTYHYFVSMVDNIRKMEPHHLTENSVLLGSPQQIIDTVKKAEAAGFDEVILYFNVGLKPAPQVKDEMARFMEEVAPAFEGKHRTRTPAKAAAK
jgi:alkanesulfonate monooxygenase SsuD/methylene tetrahydromethanopterin reductase-like flavin-dependent oxidoreductase (luciferase family)